WNGKFFQETSLTDVGLEIHLGHGGNSCPNALHSTSSTTIVVDKTGVHSLVIKECRCTGALNYHLQLFEMGLFPSSFACPRTAFTFAVLDDFLLDNLECGTSAMNYYSKLRRLTSSVLPMSVPDRYRELLRTARQMRYLKL
ncbi:hypothetical protein M405DRAFT_691042, partial [Rhizopogon salebrosus TDB-379]